MNRSRARETRRGSVRARHLVRRNFLHPTQRRRTPPTSPRERRALGTTAGPNAGLFFSSSSSSSARRSSEARRGVPRRVAVSSLVHTSRCLEPSFFSFASFFTKTCVVSPLARVTTNERGHSNRTTKKVRARLCFFKLSLRRRRRVVVVVVRHRRSERGEDVLHARNESSHRFRSVKQRAASTLVVVANVAEAHHRRR